MANLKKGSTVDGSKILTEEHYNLGTSMGILHMVSTANRVMLIDGTVTDAYEIADFSSSVPTTTKALLLTAYLRSSTTTAMILVTKPYGDPYSAAPTGGGYRPLELYSSYSSGGYIIKKTQYRQSALGGKFEYREYSAVHGIGTITFVLWGYYI